MNTTVTPRPLLPARERILLTAHDLFYRDGIRATGVDRVIAEAGVTKVTFYRHFPAKQDLILAFLEYRHRLWMDWFTTALRRHSAGRPALLTLVPALKEWFSAAEFRGCAFLNSVSELGGAMPAVLELTRSHKRDMESAIAGLLPAGRSRRRLARAVAVAVDGAIIRAQYDTEPDDALEGLQQLLEGMEAAAAGHAAQA